MEEINAIHILLGNKKLLMPLNVVNARFCDLIMGFMINDLDIYKEMNGALSTHLNFACNLVDTCIHSFRRK